MGMEHGLFIHPLDSGTLEIENRYGRVEAMTV
jgi:hypothetical protein